MMQIGYTYAQALYDLAKEEMLTEQVLQQLQVLREAFENEPTFCRLLSAPNISKEERLAVIDGGFRDQLHPYVLNFVKILTERGYIGSFADCCKAFRSLYNEDNGILQVKTVTATELTDTQREKLISKLSAITGKRIELLCKVDPEVLGGVRLSYDGKQLDGTVRNRLDGLFASLKNTVI